MSEDDRRVVVNTDECNYCGRKGPLVGIYESKWRRVALCRSHDTLIVRAGLRVADQILEETKS